MGRSKRRSGEPWWRALKVWAVPFRQIVVVVRYSYSGYPIDCHNSPARAYPRGASWRDVEREVMTMLEKPIHRRVGGAVDGTPDVCELALSWPQIYQYLTQRTYADGTPRQLSSVLVFPDGPMFRVMLKDPDAKSCCWVSGRTLAAGFAALEAALCDPDHEWRADRQQMGDTARRVKR